MSAPVVRVLGGGAGSLDLYRPFGEITPALYAEGEKGLWAPSDQVLFEQHQERGDVGITEEIGGNMLNALAWLAVQDDRKAVFLSVLGPQGDIVSDKVRERLELLGIVDLSKVSDGHTTSIGMVERMAPGSDRMIRGLPRGPMLEHLSPEYIRNMTRGIGHFMVASFKDPELNRRFFENIPTERSFVGFNPGSSEYKKEAYYDENDPRHSLKATMADHDIDFVALNGQELQEMYQSNEDPRQLALRMVTHGLARYVLCTLGKDGMVMAHNGDYIALQAKMLQKHEVQDTLGAGDRANAVASDGLMRGHEPERILRDVAEQTAHTIRVVGGHGDVAAIRRKQLSSNMSTRHSGLVVPTRFADV